MSVSNSSDERRVVKKGDTKGKGKMFHTGGAWNKLQNVSFQGPCTKFARSSRRNQEVVLTPTLGPQKNFPMTKRKALEIFCGCARLTLALSKEGFEATGVDWAGNKDKTEGRTILVDATTSWGQKKIRGLALECDFVPMAPPCGTASRSRDKRIKFGPDPKPLRSDREPDGFENLKGKNLERVQNANRIYKFVAELVEELDSKGISWSVENPRNSYMWKTRWFQKLFRNKKVKRRWMHTQMCMHGSRRNKWTSLLHGGKVNLLNLSLSCDGKHTHAPWGALRKPGGGFATSEERNYPQLFCNRIARKAARDVGIPRKEKEVTGVASRIGAGIQPRRSHRDLVHEFAETKIFTGATDSEIGRLCSSKSAVERSLKVGDLVVPGDSKLLNVEDMGDECSGLSKGEVGIKWDKAGFLQEALKAIHPFDEKIKVPQRIASTMFNMASLGPKGLVDKRKENLTWYGGVKKSLEKMEGELHRSLPPDVEKVVKGPLGQLIFIS